MASDWRDECRGGISGWKTLQGVERIARQPAWGYNASMKKMIITATLLAFSGLAQAGNFATCLLDELPGVQNNNAAGAAYQVCSARYPKRYAGVDQGSGRGFFGYESGAECALKHARDTKSLDAAGMIRVACNRLYDKPIGLFDDLKQSQN
ncbi:hypothetical protein [Aquipseudomonas campi]